MTGDRSPSTRAEPGGGADSAGVPWHGRSLAPQPFAGDDGEPDPALVAALAGRTPGGATAADVVAALARARVLVPVVAAPRPSEPAPAADGTAADIAADMAR